MGFGIVANWPAALWLIPAALVLLILFRLYRTRRLEMVTGSLMLWRRLAQQQPKTPPKRVVLDWSLVLQAAALAALVAALAGPELTTSGAPGRGVLLLLDNAPPARMRETDNAPLWRDVQEKAQSILRELKPGDTVFVARSAPHPTLIVSGVRPDDAAKAVAEQRPALSGPTAEQSWLFATDTARAQTKAGQLTAIVVSARDGPQAGSLQQNTHWLTVTPKAPLLPNVGIVDFGALNVARDGKAEVQVLVRLKNFSSQPVAGTVRCEALDKAAGVAPQEQPCKLDENGDAAMVFELAAAGKMPAVRIAWSRADGKADALPEDDAIVAAPRNAAAPRVRFHAPVPALERLYRVALNATFVAPDDPGGADLEIYAGSVPERVPENSHGIMLLAPESGYRMIFDVSGKTLVRPKLQRDESDALTKGIADKPSGIFPVPAACEILTTGDFKTLMRDAATQRAMVARFSDEKQRFGLLLAFVPGAGFPPERMIEPELAAILTRAALEAAGSGEPYCVTRAVEFEMQTGEPLALDWRPAAQTGGAGVLDEAASAATLPANSQAHTFDVASLRPLNRARLLDLRPWLIMAGLLFAALEFWTEHRTRALTAA